MFACKNLTKLCGKAGGLNSPQIQNITLPCAVTNRDLHVAVTGLVGGVAAATCMMLKQSPLIGRIHCYDIKPHTLGVALDCSHIEGRARLYAWKDPKDLHKVLSGAEVVIMCQDANGPRKKGTSRKQLFEKNAPITRDLAVQIAKICPQAIVLVVTNPVNALVPLVNEVFKQRNCYDPRKVIGMTILDTVRANRFAAHAMKRNPLEVNVPVIGGHSRSTTVPIFSRTKPKMNLSEDKVKKLVDKVKNAADAVVAAKNIDMNGNSTLAMGYAMGRFVTTLALARRGKKHMIESGYVRSDVCSHVKYFATPLVLGHRGVEKNLGLPKMNKYEEGLTKKAAEGLKKDIKMGVDFIRNASKCK